MFPEGGCAVSSYFEEETRGDWFDRLDEVFANKEMADDEGRAGADPLSQVRAVSVVEIVVLILLSIKFPLTFIRKMTAYTRRTSMCLDRVELRRIVCTLSTHLYRMTVVWMRMELPHNFMEAHRLTGLPHGSASIDWSAPWKHVDARPCAWKSAESRSAAKNRVEDPALALLLDRIYRAHTFTGSYESIYITASGSPCYEKVEEWGRNGPESSTARCPSPATRLRLRCHRP